MNWPLGARKVKLVVGLPAHARRLGRELVALEVGLLNGPIVRQ